MSAKLRVLALVHRHLIPPDAIEEGTDIVSAPWRTEYDVISTLRTLGHEVQALDALVDPSAMSMGSTAENLHDRFPELTKERADALANAISGAGIVSHPPE